jgi:hypothetical protein
MPYELVKPGNADPGLPFMGVVVVVADVEEKVSVIEDADAGELAVSRHENSLPRSTMRTSPLA